ncbi:phage major capsid protein, P2 family [Xenorhabdus bovienii]|uniref:phage major capsid protein, P2 family n=1 Tax=Xenorhabdus bovienii TaxID=40576 RepID=UPI0023B2E430|nr:phage major capsid protein, P2 family [Xenorhabdus bovienii]MDE9552530.1 phage major capsid protein, P2 family [Xenorhabdus bovienii]MDE9557060.1 phage major capsid protein, P2 family [Xenorhabdus bovienii]MDE9589285.1 phage major capsid protein, P2 family [Xenorhabdus bovienii]
MSLSNEGRQHYLSYLDQQGKLNGVDREGDSIQLTVSPAVQQRLEKAKMESSPFLKEINSIGVTELEGEKIGVGINRTIASRNVSTSDRREPVGVHDLQANRYRCEQTNFDTYIGYTQIDAWAGHPEFQQLISQQIVQQEANDRLMIGFNGTSCALKSDREKNPLLQDINIGWLQHLRNKAPGRVMKGITLTSRDEDGKIIKKGQYGNYDSVVYDAVNTLLDPWHQSAPGLLAITGSRLTTQKNFKILNQHSQHNPNMELLAGNELMKLSTLGGLPVFRVPFFPDGAIFITTFKNLSLYWQKGKYNRYIKNEPEYNRIATYAQSNDGYVIEDYGLSCLIEDISFAGAESGGE